MRWVGVDFGTSNTSAALPGSGLVALEPGRTAVPTAVFLDFGARAMLFGSPAVEALVEGREGRFLRALKRVLGTPLLREPRQLLNERTTLLALVAEVLRRVRLAAEREAGEEVRGVVAGRPVIFHADEGRDAQAAVDLGEAYRMAGFEAVEWMAEPEAAALACGVRDGLGLVVDIGGGTSDFTLFEAEGGRIAVRGTAGVRLGGTDADRTLSLLHAMPLLGMGTRLRAEIGGALSPVPVAPFHELATWERIAFLQAPAMVRDARRMVRLAESPERLGRLHAVLEGGLGFDLAFAVERGKIAAAGGGGRIDLGVVERGLGVALSPEALAAGLAGFADAVAEGARACLARAGVAAGAVTHVVHVGGSSLLPPVRAAMARLMPGAEAVETAAFTAVAEGLAVSAAAR